MSRPAPARPDTLPAWEGVENILRIAALILLTACTGVVTGEAGAGPGHVLLCLGADGGLPAPTQVDTYRFWRFTGAPTAATPTFEIGPCSTGIAPTEVLSLQTGDGLVVHLGWTATAEGGLSDFTPQVDVDGELALVFGKNDDWGSDEAAALYQDGSLVFAAEAGFSARLDVFDDDLPITVERGARSRQLDEDPCGTRWEHRVRFVGDDTVELDTWVEGTVTLAGTTDQARNVGAWSFDEEISCTDLWGPLPWVLWR